MRHLLSIDISATLRRSKPVEQFLGRRPVDPTYIRHIELRPANDSIELWIHGVEDVGSEGYFDLYDFPHSNRMSSMPLLPLFRTQPPPSRMPVHTWRRIPIAGPTSELPSPTTLTTFRQAGLPVGPLSADAQSRCRPGKRSGSTARIRLSLLCRNVNRPDT